MSTQEQNTPSLTTSDITEEDSQAIIDWCNERFPIDGHNYRDNNEQHLAAMLAANHFVMRSYKMKQRIEELEFALKLQGKSGQEIKWFNYDMFRMELVKFALAYNKSTNKDISNDSAEWAHEIFTKSSHE